MPGTQGAEISAGRPVRKLSSTLMQGSLPPRRPARQNSRRLRSSTSSPTNEQRGNDEKSNSSSTPVDPVGESSQPVASFGRHKSREKPTHLAGDAKRPSLRRTKTIHFGTRRKAPNLNRPKQSREALRITSDQEDSHGVAPLRRIKSLNKPLHSDEELERYTLRRRSSSFRTRKPTSVTRQSKQTLEEEESNRYQMDHTADHGTHQPSDYPTSQGIAEFKEVNKTPRRSQSFRGEGRPRSGSKRISKKSSSSAIEQDDGSKIATSQRRLSREVRRSRSLVWPSATADLVESPGSSKSSSGTSSSSSNTRRRTVSLTPSADERIRGDQAPVTPRRLQASPITSDSGASPPERHEGTNEESSAYKRIVSTSRVKREPTRPRSRSRLLKSKSDSRMKSMSMTGEITTISPDSSQSSCSGTYKSRSSSPSGELIPPPPLATGSPPKSKHRQPKKPEAPDESTKKNAKEKRRFGLTRLVKSFSLGSPKQYSNIPVLRRNEGPLAQSSASSIYPGKGVIPARFSNDDSTERSNTERTVSTMSTRTSSTVSCDDLSSSSMDLPFSPLLSESAPLDPLASFQTFSKSLARLRHDFGLPTAEEEDDDYEDEEPRRPLSMGSLTSHLEMTRARVAGKQDDREADEDSTMVSTFEARAPHENSLRLSLLRSSSIMKRRAKSSSFGKDKCVCFGSVNVREYERTVGDNPCSAGVPIGLGWSYRHYLDVNVDIYESSVRKPSPRSGKDFYLTPDDRLRILRDECGCSPQEITRAKGLAGEVRYQRKMSIADLAQRQQLSSPISSRPTNVREPTPAHSRSRSTGSMNLPVPPNVDTRWETGASASPAAPGIAVNR
jgi:hypothetical protein